MHIYEIMLANGDRVCYKTDMSFNEFKQYISKNEWITIEREPWVSIPNGWSSRPAKASYQTKSIVYVDWNKEWEDYCKEKDRQLEKQRELKEEVLKYKPNWRLKWKYRWDFSVPWLDDEGNALYTDGYLKKLLDDCKKCGCEKIE